MKAKDLKNLLPDRYEMLDEESKPWAENKIRTGFNRCLDELAEKEIAFCDKCTRGKTFGEPGALIACEYCQGHGIVVCGE